MIHCIIYDIYISKEIKKRKDNVIIRYNNKYIYFNKIWNRNNIMSDFVAVK